MMIFFCSIIDGISSACSCPLSLTMTTLDLLEPDTNISVNACPSALGCLTPDSGSFSTTMPSTCRYFIFVVCGLVAGTVCILGLFGNLISVAVLSQDSKTPVASFQLMTLAVADNLLLALWFIHYSLRFVIEFTGSQIPAALTYVRVYTFPVLYTAQTWTIWLTVVIAFTRYIAVCCHALYCSVLAVPGRSHSQCRQSPTTNLSCHRLLHRLQLTQVNININITVM